MGTAAFAAAVADDTLDEEAAGEAGAHVCLPAAAAGQCTAADAEVGATYVAALPCDGEGTTTPDDASDDCPSTDAMGDGCEVCMWKTGEVTDWDAPVAAELEAAMAICDPAEPDKTSGSAGLVVSLALVSVSAVVAQL
jgi:hypothetical protein